MKRASKLIAALVAVAVLLTLLPLQAFQASADRVASTIVMRLNSTKALLNGAEIAVDPSNPDVAPFTLNSKTMVPVRFVQQLGADVKYENANAPVTVSYGDIVLTLEFDNPVMKKKVGETSPIDVTLPTAPTMVEGKTCVPIREVAEGLGFFVKYDSATSVIVVSTGILSDADQVSFIDSGAKGLPSFIEGVRSITAKKPSLTANIGDTIQLSKTDFVFDPAKVGCDKLVYSSDNTSIATVTSQGRVKAIANGIAKITVSSHNGKTAVITLTVGSGGSSGEYKVTYTVPSGFSLDGNYDGTDVLTNSIGSYITITTENFSLSTLDSETKRLIDDYADLGIVKTSGPSNATVGGCKAKTADFSMNVEGYTIRIRSYVIANNKGGGTFVEFATLSDYFNTDLSKFQSFLNSIKFK